MERNDVFATSASGMTQQQDSLSAAAIEELKAHYLREFALLFADLRLPGHTDAECLDLLQKEYKEMLGFLHKLLDASLCLDLTSLYKVTFAYLMCDDIPKEERIRTGKGMEALFRLLSLLQQKSDVTAELYNLYVTHADNMKEIMRRGGNK